MKLRSNIKRLSLLFLACASVGLGSCTHEERVDGPTPGGDGLTAFSVNLPAVQSVQTRAASAADENNIASLWLLLCNVNDGTYVDKVACTVTEGNGTAALKFKARLTHGQTYDLILVANADVSTLAAGDTRAQVQTKLQQTLATAWAIYGTGKKSIPMWGELTAQNITETYTPAAFNLRRMLARVNVTSTVATDKFELTSVNVFNYNTKGHLIPNKASGSYVYPSVPSSPGAQVGADKYLAYTTIATKNKCLNEIYLFEAAHAAPYGTAGWTANPCIVIGGKYEGGSETFYRLDYVGDNAGSEVWYDLKRNFSYNVTISAVGGPGYTDIGDAYASRPINIDANVYPWDDSEMKEGVWNDNHMIRLTGTSAHFNQFGVPTPQEFTIVTSLSSLTFEGFTNNSAPAGTAVWSSAGANKWTNGHFTVTATPTTSGGHTVYTLKVEAKTAASGDIARDSRFRIKGDNLEVEFRITQDTYVQYRLITTYNGQNNSENTTITLDGASQRIPIGVESTHDYKVTLNNSMFPRVWSAATAGTDLTGTTIAPTQTTVWVEVTSHGDPEPRVGDFIVAHAEALSTASPVTYNVLQVTPAITAVLSDGGYAAELPKSGGTASIKVSSNLSAWTAVLSINGTPVTTGLTTYFAPATGSNNATVTFTAPTFATGETTDQVYTITFGDGNGTNTNANPIVITQKAQVLGVGGGGNPGGYILAPENILAVNNLGQLNLDGQTKVGVAGTDVLWNYVVYFIWGSTIASQTAPNGDVFDRDDIAWTPEGFDYNALYASMAGLTGKTAWVKIKRSWDDTLTALPANDPVNGWGDPCKLAVKNGAVGNYMTPQGNPYTTPDFPERIVNSPNEYWRASSPWGPGMYDLKTDTGQFYPAAGFRYTNGNTESVGIMGAYQSNVQYNMGNNYFMRFTATEINKNIFGSNDYGWAVRCVESE